MKKVLLFGATGNLGKEIACEAKSAGYNLSVAIRKPAQAGLFKNITPQTRLVNFNDIASLQNACNGFDVIISSLGKSVSLNDKSKTTFTEIDFGLNSSILDAALKSGVKKFVYVSALHSENYPDLEYFRAHHGFSEKLKRSGINYSIVKPPAIFSAFLDLIQMAKRGKLVTVGKGDKKTNPIYEGDLAKICVSAIEQVNSITEAGGPEIKTRREINDLIQEIVAPDKKVRNLPEGMIGLGMPLMKIFMPSSHSKFAFFMEVLKHDTLGPAAGQMKLEDYIRMKMKTGL
jgi:uncharacterized protein YbjT (DUF2867 family)